jgi:hypothetical protein
MKLRLKIERVAQIARARYLRALSWHQRCVRVSFVAFVIYSFIFGIFGAWPSETVTADQTVTAAPESVRAAAIVSATPGDPSPPSEFARAYAALPVQFEPNLGQLDDAVRFGAHGLNYSVQLTDQEARLTVCPPSKADGPQHAVRMRLLGSRTSREQIQGEQELPSRSNYFLGSDPSRWRTNVRHYGRVVYRSVYPGIDLVYYGSNQTELEFDFVVSPGADSDEIRISYDGVHSLEIDPAGALVLDTSCGPIRQHRPIVYQTISGERRFVEGEYVKAGPREARFRIGIVLSFQFFLQ